MLPIKSKVFLIGFIIYAVIVVLLLSTALLPDANPNYSLLSLEAALFFFFGLFPILSAYVAISHIKLLKRIRQSITPDTFS